MRKKARNRKIKGTSRLKPESPLVWIGLAQGSSLNLLILISIILGSGLSVVSMTYQNRFLFNELQQLRSQSNNLEVKWGQLLIEQSTFGLEGRIEKKATEELRLHVPDLGRIVMVTHD